MTSSPASSLLLYGAVGRQVAARCCRLAAGGSGVVNVGGICTSGLQQQRQRQKQQLIRRLYRVGITTTNTALQKPRYSHNQGQRRQPRQTQQLRSFSGEDNNNRVGDSNDDNFKSITSMLVVDPSSLIGGLTREKMERDPVLASYVRSNFPAAFSDYDENAPSDPSLSIELDDEEYAELFDVQLHQRIDKKKNKGKKSKKERDLAKQPYPRNIRPLKAYRRHPIIEEGSRACRKLRYHHLHVPGIVYGADPTQNISAFDPDKKIFVKTPWNELQRELDRYHNQFESRVYDLTVYESPEAERDDPDGGVVHRVLPKNVQRHPVKTSLFCCNYVRYHPGRVIPLPYRLINEEESPALKRESFVIPIQRYIEVLVRDEDAPIPEYLELECTGLAFREVVRLDRLVIPDGVELSPRVQKHNDFIIGVVFGRSRDAAADAESEAKASSED